MSLLPSALSSSSCLDAILLVTILATARVGVEDMMVLHMVTGRTVASEPSEVAIDANES